MPARDSEDAVRAAHALLRAHLREDPDGMVAIVNTIDTRDLLSALVGVAIAFGVEAYGSLEEVDASLAAFQEMPSGLDDEGR
jgi:hypothetical protein